MQSYKHLPTLAQLRHLIALQEHGHFGRAADACFITQSSLSTSIKELERTLGSQLVERTKRSVMMSALGTEVVERARRVVIDVEEICDTVNAANAPLDGIVRLGVIPSIAPFLLPRALPSLRKAYPGLKLYLREALSAKLINLLANGSLDALLIAFPYSIKNMESHIFAEDPFWVAFPKGHPFADKPNITLHDLKNQDFMLLEEGHCLRDHIVSATGGTLLEGDDNFHASSLHTLVQMVENGLGVTLLPKMAIDTGLTRSTGVQVKPLSDAKASRQIGMVWRKTSARKLEFMRLSEFFRDELATPVRPRSKQKN